MYEDFAKILLVFVTVLALLWGVFSNDGIRTFMVLSAMRGQFCRFILYGRDTTYDISEAKGRRPIIIVLPKDGGAP